jgi:hypothetical protein
MPSAGTTATKITIVAANSRVIRRSKFQRSFFRFFFSNSRGLVKALKAEDLSASEIAKRLGIGRASAYRILASTGA